ncbi:site-specific integrase, partial [Gammaproteobacteria bacterium]|nr:site-specific integrase [Gammaproteobacteria bacterium]
MTIENKKDHFIDSFLDSLYIEKGLSNNTVSSYKNDIKSFFLWLDENSFNPLNINASDANNYVSKLFGDGLKSS